MTLPKWFLGPPSWRGDYRAAKKHPAKELTEQSNEPVTTSNSRIQQGAPPTWTPAWGTTVLRRVLGTMTLMAVI